MGFEHLTGLNCTSDLGSGLACAMACCTAGAQLYDL